MVGSWVRATSEAVVVQLMISVTTSAMRRAGQRLVSLGFSLMTARNLQTFKGCGDLVAAEQSPRLRLVGGLCSLLHTLLIIYPILQWDALGPIDPPPEL